MKKPSKKQQEILDILNNGGTLELVQYKSEVLGACEFKLNGDFKRIDSTISSMVNKGLLVKKVIIDTSSLIFSDYKEGMVLNIYSVK